MRRDPWRAGSPLDSGVRNERCVLVERERIRGGRAPRRVSRGKAAA
jgi:hypothetical protein